MKNLTFHCRSLIFATLLSLSFTASAGNLFSEGFSNEQTDNTSAAVRSRAVNIATGELLSTAPSASALQARQQTSATANSDITINLFDDTIVSAQLTESYVNQSGSMTWIGEIANQQNGTAIFIINGDKVYGVVESAELGNYSIRPTSSSSAHVVEQIRPNAILSGESDIRLAPPSTLARPETNPQQFEIHANTTAPEDDGSIIDVYIAYDADANGGSVAAADAQGYAELFIAYTNTAYKNSGITQRVWLTGSVEGYNYNYTGNSQALTDARAGNGTLAGLHTKRDEYHADLVAFFTPAQGNNCAGLAYLQTPNNDISFESAGFSVMNACSFGSPVFAHELGHNMGSRHDWYVDPKITPKTYAHGFIDTAKNFRTIMAYANRCNSLSISCSTVAHFSNPAINYNGNKAGVAGGTNSTCVQNDNNPAVECDADNGTNFNEKAPTTAKFRDSRIIWTGAAGSDWSNAANWAINQGKPGATTAVNRTPRSFDNVYIPAGAGNYPTIAGTATARSITIANGATLNMTGGTLTIGWNWNDAGGFTATGGTVKFISPIELSITSAAASNFYNVEIGSGSGRTAVALSSNIDINGDLNIKAGSNLKADTHTITLAGNWSESDADGFSTGTGTVVFDGTAQTVSKTTTISLLDENFSAYDSSCCGSGLPSGWASSNGRTYQVPFLLMVPPIVGVLNQMAIYTQQRSICKQVPPIS